MLIYEKSNENNLIHSILNKTLTGPKPLRITFDK